MSENTKTPRTDARLRNVQGLFKAAALANGFADFARELELETQSLNAELAEARKERDALLAAFVEIAEDDEKPMSMRSRSPSVIAKRMISMMKGGGND